MGTEILLRLKDTEYIVFEQPSSSASKGIHGCDRHYIGSFLVVFAFVSLAIFPDNSGLMTTI